MRQVWRFLLLGVAVLIAWRMVVFGLSAHYMERIAEGDETAVDRALAWNARSPEALILKALDGSGDDAAVLEPLLSRAYRENPTQASALLALARLAEARGDAERADSLIKAAVSLRPADAVILRRAGTHWAERGNPDAAIRHWSRALESRPSVRQELFPMLLRVAEDPQARAALKPLASSPPSWWDDFFALVARRALETETVRALYAMRRGAGGASLSERERRAYVARLQKDGLVTEAYLTWINGLSEPERGYLGLVFNGGFELEPSNTGFGWHLHKTGQTRVNRAATFGVDGEKALHLVFERREKPFRHLFQPLFLDAGDYRLSGQVRTDGLETRGGLRWVINCRQPKAVKLGESERFLGSGEWREFDLEFQVPESCELQEIRLQSAGRTAFEHKMAGGVWFDGLAIRKLRAQPAVAVADAPAAAPEREPPTTGEPAPAVEGGRSAPEQLAAPDEPSSSLVR